MTYDGVFFENTTVNDNAPLQPGVSSPGGGNTKLLSISYPRLRTTQRAAGFCFFEPTLLMVLSGKMDIHHAGNAPTFTPLCNVGIVEQGTIADYTKLPQEPDGYFRSVFITVRPEVLEQFYHAFPDYRPAAKKSAAINETACDAEWQSSLSELLISLERPLLSEDRIRLKIFDLLLVLAQRNIRFSLPQQQGIAFRLSHLLREAPECGWTASMAGAALAMSESTLRRKLRLEGQKFEAVLLEVRMHHALMLIQTTSWSLTQIADACGYRSVARFSERFKSRFGVSPARVY